MPPSSTCPHCRRKKENSRITFVAACGATPGISLTSLHSSQKRIGEKPPYEPIDPFKPSISYSLRHIFPSQTPPTSDADSVIAALLAPCGALSSGLTPRSQSFRKYTPPTSSDNAYAHSGDVRPPASPYSKQYMDTQHHPAHPRGGASAPRMSPILLAASPRATSAPGRPNCVGSARSDASQVSIHEEITIEAPGHVACVESKSRRSSSGSVMSRSVESYRHGSVYTGSPTLLSGSVRSGLPPLKDFNNMAPTAYQTEPAMVTLQSGQVDSTASPEHDEDSQVGVTLSIRSERLYPVPRLHNPPKPRRERRVGSLPSDPVDSRQKLESSAVPQSANDVPELSHHLLHTGKPLPTLAYLFVFVIDTIPRQLYLYLMLCIPYMYFSRVANIFEEAQVSLPKIKQGIIQAAYKAKEYEFMDPDHQVAGASIAANFHRTWRFEAPNSPGIAYFNLQRTWETFVSSLMSEWQTLNIISVLLMSAIVAILQISAPSNDLVTRYLALSSLICALMSLIYGCVYIIRFGSMRKAFKAAMWAAEAQRSTTCLLWNVWVFLALPATWLAWSMILFIACIMSLIWRTGTIKDPETIQITLREARPPRIAITLLLTLGVIYFIFILRTLRRYGNEMDKKWHKTVSSWISSQQENKLAPVSTRLPSRIASPRIFFHPPRTPTNTGFGLQAQFPHSTSSRSS